MGRWVIVFVLFVTPATAQPLTSLERDQIDQGVLAILSATGAPSASIAIVRGGEIVYEHAYGESRSSPTKAADPSMRYAIGSVSRTRHDVAVQQHQLRDRGGRRRACRWDETDGLPHSAGVFAPRDDVRHQF